MSEPIKNVLAKYARRKKIDKTLVAARVLSIWPEVSKRIYPAGSDDCKAVAFRTGTVIVEVSGSALTNELRMYQDNFINQLNAAFDEPVVKEIYWRIR